MDEYRKFQLSPGQKAPEGNQGISLKDGWLVWIGEQGTFPEMVSTEITAGKFELRPIASELMTQAEIDEYLWIKETPAREAEATSIVKKSVIVGLSYTDVETYIENNVTNLAEAKAYLKKLSKVVLALAKREANE